MSQIEQLQEELALLRKRLERERDIRKQAEALAEQGLRDLYDRQRQTDLLRLVAASANQATHFHEALEQTLQHFCAYLGWPLAVACLPSGPDEFRPSSIWHLEDASRHQAFRDSLTSQTFARGAGLPGKVLETGEAQWSESLCLDPAFPHRFPCQANGVCSGFGLPVLVERQVVAMLLFFSPNWCQASPETLALGTQIATKLERVFEREQAREALHRTRAELESRVEERTTALAEMNTALESSNHLLAASVEQANKLALDAQQANRAKGEFLSSITHELRTPLNGILGYTQVLLRETSEGDSKRTGLQVIQECGENLLALINDILDFTRAESGQLKLDLAETNVPGLLKQLVEVNRPKAQDKGLAFETHFSQNLPLTVMADSRRLSQVLTNLLSNAIKYTERGRVALKVSRQGTLLQFEVVDTGPGIAPELRQSIFEPLNQSEGALRKKGGKGLGLAICRRLAELMNGRLLLESEVGQGSKFRLEVELPVVAEKPASQSTIVGYQGERRRILVVDDNAVNRLVLVRALQSIGFDLSEAADAGMALDRAAQDPPHLIITDLELGQVSGFELTRQLRARPELRTIPIVAVTGLSQADDEQSSAPARPAVSKSFSNPSTSRPYSRSCNSTSTWSGSTN